MVCSYTRGSKRLALDIASDPVALRAAIDTLESHAFAATSKAPRASRSALWEEVLRTAGVPDPYALTPDTVVLGAAVLRAAGYRSAMSYVDQAIVEFKEHGGTVSQELARAVHRARKACSRGLGRPRHTSAFPVDRIHELPEGPAPWVEGGPVFPRRCILIGCWWLLREIEFANALAEDASLTHSAEARLNLPASKADTRALGAARCHQCACGTAPGATRAMPRAACPRCELEAQLAYASTAVGGAGPLFPTATGSHASKAAVVATLKAGAKLLGLPLENTNGSDAWGGHAMRRGGAQHLGACGVDVWRIQALARHSSSAILLYLEDSHVLSLGSVAAEAAMGRSLDQVRSELRALEAQKRELSLPLPGPSTSIQVPVDIDDVLGTVDQKGPGPGDPGPCPNKFPFVLSCPNKGRVHVRDPAAPDITLCRWKWRGAKAAEPVWNQACGLPCTKCVAASLKSTASARRQSEDQSSSSESSASSESA